VVVEAAVAEVSVEAAVVVTGDSVEEDEVEAVIEAEVGVVLTEVAAVLEDVDDLKRHTCILTVSLTHVCLLQVCVIVWAVH